MRTVRALTAVALAFSLASCGQSSDTDADKPKPGVSTTASPTKPELEYDPKTRQAAQELLDGVVDRMLTDETGQFTTYVNFGGLPIQVTASYDLARRLMKTTTVMPSPSEEEDAPDVVTIRGRVLGADAYANVGGGPFARCWFHYSTSAFQSMFGVTEAEMQYMAFHPLLGLVADARAIGSSRTSDFEIHAKVSALAAVAAILPQAVAKNRDDLPDQDIRIPGTITVQNSQLSTVKVRVRDVFDALEKTGMDLFGAEDREEIRNELATSVYSASFSKFGDPVSVKKPAFDSIIEVSGPTDIDESNTLCRASQS